MARALDSDTLAGVIGLRDWLVTVAVRLDQMNEILAGFIERLRGLGLPIDRAAMAIRRKRRQKKKKPPEGGL